MRDLGQATGVVAIRLGRPQRQLRLGPAGIDAMHHQAARAELVPQPGRQPAGLEQHPRRRFRQRRQRRSDRRGLGCHAPLQDHRPGLVDHAHRGLFQ